MKLNTLGHSGLDLARIGLGTMTWGRDTDELEAAEQLRIYLDAGGNFLDTAPIYGDGDSERVIGGLIGVLAPREELIIATKAGLLATPMSANGRRVDNSRRNLIRDLDGSLGRLGVDYIDLWQIHKPDPFTPLEETLAALDYAVNSGKARYVGLCNHSGWQFAKAAALQNPLFGKATLLSHQVEYSLLNRTPEEEVLPAAEDAGACLIAWSPLGRGVLSGKYRNGIPADSRAATPHFANFIAPYLDARAQNIVDAVAVAAEGLGFSPLEVALAWIRDIPSVATCLVGARTAAQLRGALTVEQIELPYQVRQALDEVSAVVEQPS